MRSKTAEDLPWPLTSQAGTASETVIGEESELDYFGDPGPCEVCGRPLTEELFFCDAELPGHGGRWGVLCRICTDSEGVRPGWGRAQFYERRESPLANTSDRAEPARLQWRCVAGQPRA